jgi:hypothetical protein
VQTLYFPYIYYAQVARCYSLDVATVPPELFGINIKEIARICAVSEKTASRWKAGTVCPPKTALWILAGDLGCLDPAWRGWIIRGSELVSREGWCITVNDVLASPLLRQQLAVYQAENRRLREDREASKYAEDQPLPGSDPEILAQIARLSG